MILRDAIDLRLALAAVADASNAGTGRSHAELAAEGAECMGGLDLLEAALLMELRERGTVDLRIERTAAGVVLRIDRGPEW